MSLTSGPSWKRAALYVVPNKPKPKRHKKHNGPRKDRRRKQRAKRQWFEETQRRLLRDRTPQERRLASWLKSAGVKAAEQVRFGRYFVDFLIGRLVVELDGRQHTATAAIEKDAARTAYLKSRGLRVIRFRNDEVTTENHESVVARILDAHGGG